MSIRSPQSAFQRIRLLGSAGLNLVFPPFCAFCQAETSVNQLAPQLCLTCISRVFTPRQPSCCRCGAFGSDASLIEVSSPCPACRGRVLKFDSVFSLGPYRGFLKEAVLRMKYESGQPLAAAVGRRLADLLNPVCAGDLPELATCIPKYWLKRLWTGVNSAEVLLSSLSERAGIPGAGSVLVSRRKTNKQSMLSPEQRRRNVRGALGVRAGHDLAGMHILLVDDVMTTGATADEAARALRRAGARRVTVAVVGRAVHRAR